MCAAQLQQQPRATRGHRRSAALLTMRVASGLRGPSGADVRLPRQDSRCSPCLTSLIKCFGGGPSFSTGHWAYCCGALVTWVERGESFLLAQANSLRRGHMRSAAFLLPRVRSIAATTNCAHIDFASTITRGCFDISTKACWKWRRTTAERATFTQGSVAVRRMTRSTLR